jgi:hypothetical protein
MPNFIRAIKFVAVIFFAAATLAGASTPSHAQTGAVRLHIVKAGFIIGLGGGNGVLLYHGHRYPLSIGGIGVGSLGIAAPALLSSAVPR